MAVRHSFTFYTIQLRNAAFSETERFYGKDAQCPKSWEESLLRDGIIPENLQSKGKEDFLRHLPDEVIYLSFV